MNECLLSPQSDEGFPMPWSVKSWFSNNLHNSVQNHFIHNYSNTFIIYELVYCTDW